MLSYRSLICSGGTMTVDSYRWLPRSLADIYRKWPLERIEPLPWTPLPEPLSTCKLALVTTAGVYVEGHEPAFDVERERREPTWGDPTHRTIPSDAPRQEIGTSHLHVNNEFVRADLNVVLPLDAAEAALAAGRIGALAETHYSLLGYQLDTTVWETQTAPHVAELLRHDGVNVALLTPYCPDCCRTVTVLAHALEARGIATVVVTPMPIYSERIGLPRTLGVEHPYGQPMGPAGDRARQQQVLDAALAVLERATEPGHIEESPWDWPDARQARKTWHPSEPSPIVAQMLASDSWVPPWELRKADAARDG
jgi:D-proline reductase (dithiol) PrdB